MGQHHVLSSDSACCRQYHFRLQVNISITFVASKTALFGNADAHAKNFALLFSLDTRSPSFSPIYDVVCTANYPQLSKQLTMKIGGRNLRDTIHLKH